MASRLSIHLTLVLLIAGLAGLNGCQTAQQWRTEADDVADDIITAGQKDAYGHTEPFTIDRPSDTLRRRLLTEQELAMSAGASLGSSQLKPIAHWPDDDYLNRRRPEWSDIVEVHGGRPVEISLTQALQIAARNSRDYQTEKENVFRTALALDLQRNEFRNTYFGAIASSFDNDFSGDDLVSEVRATGTIGLERKFKNGISVSTRLGIDLVQLLTQDGSTDLGLLADISVTIPLLAGSGEHIVTEPLIQAERNVLYALWDFDRFRRSFAVRIASSYLSVLQQLDRVANAESNYRSLITSQQRSIALAEAGRLSEVGVDQVRQDVLRARNSWIIAREQFARQLDNLKITLGLPTDAKIELDHGELQRLAESGRTALGLLDEAMPAEFREVDGQIVILEPSTKAVGPLELPEDRLVRLAFTNRRDLMVTPAGIDDALRDVVVKADALRPGLTVRGGASVGERRDASTLTAVYLDQLRFEDGRYTLSVDFDFPWDKVPERNAYRNALIDLERQVRSLQSLEDQIKLDVRDGLRALREARESYRIQAKAVSVAQRRVDSTDLFLQAGRAQVRDLLDAQESLNSAKNALTAALVSYRVSELELQRDMGVLEVNENGLWTEYRPREEATDGNNEQAQP